jgi:hypothetical protein
MEDLDGRSYGDYFDHMHDYLSESWLFLQWL